MSQLSNSPPTTLDLSPSAQLNPFQQAALTGISHDLEPDQVCQLHVDAALAAISNQSSNVVDLSPEVMADLWIDLAWLAALDAPHPAVLQAEDTLAMIALPTLGVALPLDPIRSLHGLLLALGAPKSCAGVLPLLWPALASRLDGANPELVLDAWHGIISSLSANDGLAARRSMRAYFAALAIATEDED